MTLPTRVQETAATRRIGAVPWYRDGYHGLSVRAGADVPTFEDPMIRGALVRGALACKRIEDLDRVLNRELWPLGYLARIEPSPRDRSLVHVEIASCR
jgi:hypothetical protein